MKEMYFNEENAQKSKSNNKIFPLWWYCEVYELKNFFLIEENLMGLKR